jgi:hypothetical protein
MTRPTKDNDQPHEPRGAPPEATSHQRDEAIARLEKALAEETRTSSDLRDHLAKLSTKVDQLEATFATRLADAVSRSNVAEAKLADQQTRLAVLGSGREESMRALGEARAEVRRLGMERDELRKQLSRIDGMQTATIALPDNTEEQTGIREPLPSIEDLMASLSSFAEVGAETGNGHLHLHVPTEAEAESSSQEMIAPELVFPEQYGEAESEPSSGAAHARTSRVLVFLDAEQPIKYPLYKDVMTIGRADSADIQINSDFISRVHARLVSTTFGVFIEDVDSKNGIKVNSKLAERQALQHGDVLGLGRLRFTFIDTTVGDPK